jgi:hypothetical protein
MSVRIDAKGKTYTDIIHKDEVPALIQTTANLIHGHIYLRAGLRLKDELNGTAEQFIAVTDAEVYNASGQVLVRSEFLTLNKGQIIWVHPDDETKDKPGAEASKT